MLALARVRLKVAITCFVFVLQETIAPEVIRARLEKCGKLELLKSKLAEMNSTLKAVRKIEEEKNKLAVAADKLASTSAGEKSTLDIQPVTE